MSDNKESDIAIVGIACRFPDAKNYTQFWQNLLAERNSIKEISAERWDYTYYYSQDRGAADKSISKWCGEIDGIKAFDNNFFSISPREAKSMDPQQRLLLQETWHCIEDSAISLKSLQSATTSVFVGAMTSDYLQRLGRTEQINNRYSILGNDHCILANRLSHQFNFTGESISINAASASSLVAIHKAKCSLIAKECDYAIAAGVNLNIDPLKYIVFSKAGMLSPDGQCHSFCENANGYVPGDGVAAILLQPLSKAIEQKNQIYGIIKGSAVNHIGSGKAITAPCVNGQEDVIRDALFNAQLTAQDVNYIETHGSGTPLGDPVEIEAFNRIFSNCNQDVLLGTVKPNIGHLEAAAGIAGVIKSLLVLKHKVVPKNLNFKSINPAINIQKSSLKLANEQHDLAHINDLIVGVSSHGFGGTSCHLLIKQFNPPVNQGAIKEQVSNEKKEFFVLSAQSEDSLQECIYKWQVFIKSRASREHSLRDICACLSTGREGLEYRVGALVNSMAELDSSLELLVSRKRNEYSKDLSFVLFNTSNWVFKESDLLVKACYKQLVAEAKQSFSNNHRAYMALLKDDEIKNTLQPIAVYKALCLLQIKPSLIEVSQYSVWAGLICSEIVTVTDFINFKLGVLNINNIALLKPSIPFLDPVSNEIVYPQYLPKSLLTSIVTNISLEKGSYDDIFKQAELLFDKNNQFKKLLCEWDCQPIVNEVNIEELFALWKNNEISSGKNFTFITIAVLDTLNKFNAKWDFEYQLSTDNKELGIIIELLNNRVLSKVDLFYLCYLEVSNIDEMVNDINRMYWKELSVIIPKYYESKVVFTASEKGWLDKLINIKNITSNYYDGRKLIIGELSSSKATFAIKKSDHYLPSNDEWQNVLLTLWLQGYELDWAKIYPVRTFNKISLPNYSFAKKQFWTSATEHKSLVINGTDIHMEDRKDVVNKQSETETEVNKNKLDRDGLTNDLKFIVATVMQLDVTEIDVSKNFDLYGYDSMAYTELSEKLNAKYQLELTPASFYEIKTTQKLIDRVFAAENGDCKTKMAEDPTNNIKNKEVIESGDLNESNYPEGDSDIAIVGFSGMFPEARNTQQFWDNLVSGKDCITEIPSQRWDWRTYYSTDIKAIDKTPSKWGGFIPRIEYFDANFFSISPLEARLMDPQQRILLKSVWQALEHSGHSPSSLSGSNSGVFIGVSTSDYEELVRNSELAAHASTGMNRSIIANRVSFLLDLHGPSEVIDTACSSSLVAIHQAVEAIKSGNCSLAIAGGVNALITPTHYISYGKAGMLSADGHCKTFDKSANGYVRGEGCGVVILKSLRQATSDNDHIYGVIKASGTNHGGRAGSLTAPNPSAQAELIKDTFRKANIAPNSIDYIETHGTGTPLGDPIEVNGLKMAFEGLSDLNDQSLDKKKCYLSSVKTNIGHLEAAAGVAGLIKILLSFSHNKMIATKHFSQLNPYIKLDDSPFEVLSENRPWRLRNKSTGSQKRAAISSFGFGGVNAHMVLEDFDNRNKGNTTIYPKLVLLSAKSSLQLHQYAQLWLSDLKKKQSCELLIEDVAFTSQVGRDAEKYRLAMCVSSIQELIESLSNYTNNIYDQKCFASINQKDSKNKLSESDVFSSKNISDKFIELLIEEKKIVELAKTWTLGCQVNWSSFYKNTNKPSRIAISSYPFLEKPFWVKERLVAPKELKKKGGPKGYSSLVKLKGDRKNKATYSVSLENNFITNEHKIHGNNISPGVFCFELIAQLLKVSDFVASFKVKEIVWVSAIEFLEAKQQIFIDIETDGEYQPITIYTFSKNKEKNVHAFAKIEIISEPRLILKQTYPVYKLSKNNLIEDDYYSNLSLIGFEYGKSFRGIDSAYLIEGKLLTEVSLPDSLNHEFELFEYHPVLLDAALQSCLLYMLYVSDLKVPLIPIFLEEVKFYKPLINSFKLIVSSQETIRQGVPTLEFNIVAINNNEVLFEVGKALFKVLESNMTSLPGVSEKERNHQVKDNKELLKSPLLKAHKANGFSRVIGKHSDNYAEDGVRNKEMESKVVNSNVLLSKTVSYFIKVIADSISEEISSIDTSQSFKEYGIDSFLTLSITRELEGVFGELRKTLFFEATNIDELAKIFVNEHQSTLEDLFSLDSNKYSADNSGHHNNIQLNRNIEKGVKNNYITDKKSVVINESDLSGEAILEKKVKVILSSFGKESIALSRKDIAPSLFIGKQELGFFYFNLKGSLLLAFRYVGPDSYFPELLQELDQYCNDKSLLLNVLSESDYPNMQEDGFSANPFAVVQRIKSLSSFSLNGSKMRRLRYLVNKFSQSGDGKTFEYKPGTDPIKDDAIANMVERWASMKSGVNPYIWRVKDEIETGCLGNDYRIFLTYLDSSLQNVIIISKMESENGYLLDTEFYSNEMAMGGLEFAIWNIIQQTQSEGCTSFSLGLTFGAEFYSANYSDPVVLDSLKKLSSDKIFSETGNYQFKNKYRTINSPLYLYRPIGQTASNVVDLIMMIGNPNNLVVNKKTTGNKSNKAVTKEINPASVNEPIKSVEKNKIVFQDRKTLLKSAGYNPINISRTDIEFDLATDSWSELEYDFIKERTLDLYSLAKPEQELEQCLSKIFDLPFVLPFSAGRVAESFLCSAWSKQKKYVLQNVLFPTCLYHQFDNDFSPLEIVHPEFLNTESEFLFKGDMPIGLLQEQLSKHQGDVAYVWIELANNATGGCPVSINNLREVKSIIGDIPLILDATRIVENAYHIAQYEEEFSGWDIWTIIREVCSYADAINASLTKDFCTHTGGFLATRDIALYEQIQDTISTNGSGLSRTDRDLISNALLQKDFILQQVSNRMKNVVYLAKSLSSAGVEVIQPVGGHCVLIDPNKLIHLSGLNYPLPSFAAWLFEETGIRVGLHSVGRQKNTSMNDLVRLAVPVGMSESQIEKLVKVLSNLLTSNSILNILELVDKPQGLFGDLKAKYRSSKELEVQFNSKEPGHSSDINIDESLVKNTSNVNLLHEQSLDSNTKNDKPSKNHDIAIIGVAGRYPDADNLQQFWDNLLAGKNSIRKGPDWQERFVHKDSAQHWGSFINDVDKFDSLFFSISPREAQNMDPQERLLMELSWATLEDAGYYPQSLIDNCHSNEIGVFIGAVWSYYEMLGSENYYSSGESIANSQHWGLSNRISSFMNFTGPSLTVDTACSSSLTAIHLACESLRSGDCKVALAGGINLDLHPNKYRITKAAQFLSEDGLCRAFGEGGSGYVAGEGVGTILLKPLAEAIEDGDQIYATIKSTVTNHGGKTSGYTVPNPRAQADLIEKAINKAGINAETINYIEAHGTGTELGDPIEVEGATKAFRKDTSQKQYCSIGSVKTNIGHLEAAAGIAGATKLLLQMKHKKLVASLHSKVLNKHINFTDSPFHVQQENSEWKPVISNGKALPRRAGLSSFGAGGTNVHIIFEEYKPSLGKKSASSKQQLVVLSAKKTDILMSCVKQLHDFVNNQQISLQNLAYTLQVGRLQMPQRVAFLVNDMGELKDKLKIYMEGAPDDTIWVTDKLTKSSLDIFSGEESEKILQVFIESGNLNKVAQLWVNGVDMNWSLFNTGTVARKVSLPTYPFAKESHWIEPASSSDSSNVKENLITSNVLHPLLDKNESTFEQQIFSKNFNLQQFVFSDHIVGGLSTLPGVGYIEMALAAAKKSSDIDVFQLRNLIWASPINSQSPREIKVILNKHAEQVDYQICTFNGQHKNTHSQGKISFAQPKPKSFRQENIEEIKKRCTGLMSKQECYALLATRKLTYGDKLQAINSFHYGKKEGLTTLELPSGLAESFSDYIAHPSLLDGAVQSIICLLEHASTVTQAGVPYVPFVLSELNVIRPLREKCFAHLVLDEDGKERDDIKKININLLDEDGNLLVQMKQFSFKAISEVVTDKKTATSKRVTRTQKNAEDLTYYKPEWALAEQLNYSESEGSHTSNIADECNAILLFDNDKENQACLQEIVGESVLVIQVEQANEYKKINSSHYQIIASSENHYQKLITSIIADNLIVNKIIHNWSAQKYITSYKYIQQQLDSSLFSVFYLTQSLLKNKKSIDSKSINLVFVAQSTEQVSQPIYATLDSFFRSIRQEGANILCKTVSLQRNLFMTELKKGWQTILLELQDSASQEIAYKEGVRHKKVLQAIEPSDVKLTNSQVQLSKDKGVYLITGGLGGLGMIFAKELASKNDVKLVLTGRSKLNAQIEKKIKQVTESASQADYLSCDLSFEDDVQQLINEILNKYGRLDGVIHSAGIIKDSFLWNKELADFKAVIAPKIMGSQYLDTATKDIALDYFIMFSSIASTNGNMGQSDYAAANRYMDEYSLFREQLRKDGQRQGKTLSINWPLWRNGGMQVSEQSENWLFDNWGMKPLSTEYGIDALHFGLQFSEASLGLVQGEKEKICRSLNINLLKQKHQDEPKEIKAKPKTVMQQAAVLKRNVNDISQDELINSLRDDLSLMVVQLLKIKKSDIHFTANMSTFGFDSVTFTEFTNLINNQLELEITPLIFFEQETLDELCDYLLDDCKQELEQHYANGDLETEVSFADDNSSQVADKSETTEQQVAQESDGFTVAKEYLDQKIVSEKQKNHDIAIIGVSGTMPQSKDLDSFWDNLIKEKNLITEIPKDRWDWKKFYGESDLGNGKTEIKWGGFMPEVDKFDAEFFNISPIEAELIDPQQRLFLQTVWHAIEDSGYKASELSGSNTGVFVGIGSSDYHELLREQKSHFEAYSVAGWMHAVLANRISYFFNFSGPSEPIGTACSSSLVAIDRAVKAIRSGECDMCVAGGISMILNPGVHIGLGKASMLSSDGRCKTFDHRANGYVRSEGVGALLLKPLDKAIADGDNIYAVIKGSAVNHGGHVNTFTTPNPKAQAEVLKMAFEDADIDPATINYIETHGTGTALGDPIEIQGLLKAFKNSANQKTFTTTNSEYCTLGSVKTNAGHLELAAGMSGILKLVMAFKHKTIPANINFEEVNPYIKLEGSPFKLAKTTQNWEQLSDVNGSAIPRRAGVSSFGFGGVNAHIVLEEHQIEKQQHTERPSPQIITLSTKYDEGLKLYAQQVVNFIDSLKDGESVVSLSSIASGLQHGRESMPKRLAVIVEDIAQLRTKLTDYCNGEHVSLLFEQNNKSIESSFEKEKLETALQEQQLEEVARYWVNGAKIDWQLLTKRLPKLSLPVYPFQKHRYWLLDPKLTGAKLIDDVEEALEEDSAQLTISDSGIEIECIGPLSAESNSLEFKVLIDKGSLYLSDHEIAESNLLPAATYLEIVNCALYELEGSRVRSFSDIIWLHPMTNSSMDSNIRLTIERKDKTFDFSIYSLDSKEVIKYYCQGTASLKSTEIDLQVVRLFNKDKHLLGQSSDRIESYKTFKNNGFHYGDSLSVIRKLYTESDSVFGILELPDVFAERIAKNSFHSSLIDGALQSILGILILKSKGNKIQVPVSVEEVTWHKPLSSTMYVEVEEIKSSQASVGDITSDFLRIFNIFVYDGNGDLSVSFSNLEIKGFHQEKFINAVDEDKDKQEANDDESKDSLQVVNYLIELIATESKRDSSNIDASNSFDSLGVDSFLALRMTKRLEKDIGKITKTAFFDYTTIQSLADYLVEQYSIELKLFFKESNSEINSSSISALNRNVSEQSLSKHEETLNSNSLLGLTIDYLAQMIAKETKTELATIKPEQNFDSLGIDSFLSMRMIKSLEKSVGPVSKTAFFEHNSLKQLANYLVLENKASLQALLSDKLLALDSKKINQDPVSAEDGSQKDAIIKPSTEETNDDLLAVTKDYLVKMIAKETKREQSTISSEQSFDSLGIDSFLSMRLTKSLEKAVGPISKTAFFEHNSLQQLAEYLVAEYKVPLQKLLVDSLLTIKPRNSEASSDNNILQQEDLETSVDESDDDLLVATKDYLRLMVAKETKRDQSTIMSEQSFDSLGIDSFLSMRLTKSLEKAVGPISKTAFFEHNSLQQLAEYLVAEYKVPLQKLLVDSLLTIKPSNSEVSSDNNILQKEGLEASVDESDDDLLIATKDYLRLMIAKETKREHSTIKDEQSFDDFGIDSFLSMRMTKDIEKRIGAIQKSAFFEYNNIQSFAEYLITQHRTKLINAFSIDKQKKVTSGASVSTKTKVAKKCEYQVIVEKELVETSDLKQLINRLCKKYGKENHALARGSIAPLIFLASNKKAYFNFNKNTEIAFAFTYVGADEDLQELAVEFCHYCTKQGIEANMLTEQSLSSNFEMKFSSNSFGMMQRLEDLSAISLKGSKMRRLRYQISKFEMSGEISFSEYINGSEQRTDLAITQIIDSWAATKNMVNPYIWHVKELISTGKLDKQYRIFLTKVDGKLQNVIIITKLASENGYLMDLEFYPNDMPLGGLEYSIWNILNLLKKEGCDQFSLGATFGVITESVDSEVASMGVTQVLTELQAQGAFNGNGNLQFKNKFRPNNRILYLSRLASSDPDKVIEVIMMMAEPKTTEITPS